MNSILEFDRVVFFFFQKIQSPFLDYLLAWPTYLGATLIALSLCVLGVLIFDRSHAMGNIPVITVGIICAYWMAEWLKILFHRPRPHVLWEGVHTLFGAPSNNAFPSGHTAVAFTAAFILHRLYPRKIIWIYLVAVWVAVTRIYVGAHYPTDLLGGIVLGAVSASLALRWVPRKPEPRLNREII